MDETHDPEPVVILQLLGQYGDLEVVSLGDGLGYVARHGQPISVPIEMGILLDLATDLTKQRLKCATCSPVGCSGRCLDLIASAQEKDQSARENTAENDRRRRAEDP